MSDSADEIVKRMRDLRREASDDVKGIVESAKTLSDWRYYVVHHPWVCVGAAAALGFVLTPTRKPVPREDAKELVALMKKYNAGGASAAVPAKGVAGTLIGMATPFVMRAVMRAAQQHFAGRGGALASLFGSSGARHAELGDEDDRPGDEAAFHGYNIPR